MMRGQRLSNLAQAKVRSRRKLSPAKIMMAPKKRGQLLLSLPPKHMSSKSRSLLLYLVGPPLSDTPQFAHISASSKFSDPHLVQYTIKVT